jgi:hypothetical protein
MIQSSLSALVSVSDGPGIIGVPLQGKMIACLGQNGAADDWRDCRKVNVSTIIAQAVSDRR